MDGRERSRCFVLLCRSPLEWVPTTGWGGREEEGGAEWKERRSRRSFVVVVVCSSLEKSRERQKDEKEEGWEDGRESETTTTRAAFSITSAGRQSKTQDVHRRRPADAASESVMPSFRAPSSTASSHHPHFKHAKTAKLDETKGGVKKRARARKIPFPTPDRFLCVARGVGPPPPSQPTTQSQPTPSFQSTNTSSTLRYLGRGRSVPRWRWCLVRKRWLCEACCGLEG